MKTKLLVRFTVTIFLCCLSVNALAEQHQETETQPQPSSAEGNFTVMIQDNAGQTLENWTGQIFNLKEGKVLADMSPPQASIRLPSGNYVLMLKFDPEIEELKGHRPFTFTILEEEHTIFSLFIGESALPDMEKNIVRTTKGEDYLHFDLPTADPKLCKTRCEDDLNCGAYTYCYYEHMKKALCYLIRGAGTPGPANPGESCFSGIIQRIHTPYQVHITIEKPEQNE